MLKTASCHWSAIPLALLVAGAPEKSSAVSLAEAPTQLCAGCTLEFLPTDTLGARDDPAGVGNLAEVLDMGPRGFLVSSNVLGGVVIVYDSEGRYQRELTRDGDGPGELRGPPKFIMGASGIGMFVPGGPKLHLYSNDLEFTATSQFAGMMNSVSWDPMIEAWLVYHIGVGGGSESGSARLDARILLLDQGGDSIRSMQMDEESSVFDPNRRPVVAATRGMVEVFDPSLQLVGSLALELPGMDESPGGPPGMFTDLHPAPDGSGVWVFAFGTTMSVSDLMEEVGRLQAEGREPDFERLADAFVYSVRLDPGGLTLVGTDQLDTLVRPLGNGDRAFDLVDTPDGNRRVRVGRLRLSRAPSPTPPAVRPQSS